MSKVHFVKNSKHRLLTTNIEHLRSTIRKDLVMIKVNNASQLYIDPVCGMKVDPGRNRIMFTHQMRSYYFCAESCRQAFAENPEKYSEVNLPKRRGWWKRYLERLNKTTGGKPPDCCH